MQKKLVVRAWMCQISLRMAAIQKGKVRAIKQTIPFIAMRKTPV